MSVEERTDPNRRYLGACIVCGDRTSGTEAPDWASLHVERYPSHLTAVFSVESTIYVNQGFYGDMQAPPVSYEAWLFGHDHGHGGH